MTVRLGEVSVKITLDMAEAKKKIEEVKKSALKEEKIRTQTLEKIAKEEPKTGVPASRALKLQRMIAGNASRVASAGNISGVVSSFVKPGLPVGIESAEVKALGVAAAGYAAASVTAKNAPSVLEFIKAFLPDVLAENETMKEMMGVLEKTRSEFVALESTVAALLSAAAKTSDIANASLRLGGGLPSLNYYYQKNREIDSQQRQLDEKFKREKNDQVAAGIGESLKKTFEKSFFGGK